MPRRSSSRLRGVSVLDTLQAYVHPCKDARLLAWKVSQLQVVDRIAACTQAISPLSPQRLTNSARRADSVRPTSRARCTCTSHLSAVGSAVMFDRDSSI